MGSVTLSPTDSYIRLVTHSDQHFDAGKDQKHAEHVDYPMKGLDNGGPHQNEACPHDQGTQHAPKEHPILVLGRHRKVHEDEHEDKDVVDAEAFLDEIAGEERVPGFPAHEGKNAAGKDQR